MTNRNRILIFGAGFVAKPMVDYLLNHNFEVVIASRTLSKAKKLVDNHLNGKAVAFDITKSGDQLEELIIKSDLIVSLLPYSYHVKIAKICILHSKHMVTTSYVSNEMKTLDTRAKKQNITILNEIGVDPGIDHMSAMRIIDRVKANNGKILSFKSNTGGLPAPEANTNPFGYKFSWSPRGVVLAARNPARYKKNGKIIKIKVGSLFKSENIGRINITHDNLGEFQYYANRDSLKYMEIYNLPHVETMYRGTLRNIGWCETWDFMYSIGYLDLDTLEDIKGMTYAQLLAKLIGVKGEDLPSEISQKYNLSIEDETISRIKWLGLLDKKLIPDNHKNLSPFDVLVYVLNQKLSYSEGERDMIVMIHDFLTEYPDGKKEHITSALIQYGIPNGDSSMARTVSLPAAISCRLILENKITQRGVIIPTTPNLYNPILDELKTIGIEMIEEFTFL